MSTTSSAYASPYLHSHTGPGSLADVPALVSSAIGQSLTAGQTHKNRLSISSSSASSTVWSAFTDEEEDEDLSNAKLSIGAEDEYSHSREPFDGSKTSGSFGQNSQPRGSGLSYARRPSGTNNRSTIPTLNRRTSSMSSPSGGAGSPRSTPVSYNTFEEDYSDVSLAFLSPVSSRPSPRHGRKSSDACSHSSNERDADTTISSKPKRNRASLPAYFSLLTTSISSPSSHRTQRVPSSLQTLTAISRSFQSSPPTPRVANPIIDPVTAFSQGHSRPQAVEATPRGRGRQRDPNARSTSSRRSAARSPPRQIARPPVSGTSPPCAHHQVHVGAQSRARLDSIEKVTDWVSSSPVVQSRGRTLTRRNSSPPTKPRLDDMIAIADLDDDLDAVREVLARSLHLHREVPGEDEYSVYGGRDTTRGRRRANELDKPPRGVENLAAPGFGNGRSGLRARERERGRVIAR